MTRVVDTSVAISWYIEEDGSASSLPFLGADLIAPDLLKVEFANALWKKVRKAEISPLHAAAVMAEVASAVRYTRTTSLAGRALEIAIELEHPVYDCIFLALTEAMGTTLVTADAKLMRRCRGTSYGPLIELI